MFLKNLKELNVKMGTDEKIHDEYFHMLMRLFETPQMDNLKILKALINSKDDVLPLWDGTSKTRVYSQSPLLLFS